MSRRPTDPSTPGFGRITVVPPSGLVEGADTTLIQSGGCNARVAVRTLSPPRVNEEGERMRNPPILVSVIGFFAAIAGFYWIYLGLRIIGFDWFGVLGDLPAYEQSGLWGWLALAAGVAWIIAAFGLWALQRWAWLFAMIVAGFALFEAFLWFLEAPGTGVGFASAIMPAIIILYLNSKDIKSQFIDSYDDQA